MTGWPHWGSGTEMLSRSSLQEYFEREGFSVAVVEDGATALAMLSQVNPDLIILDIQLPHVDGLNEGKSFRQQGFKHLR